jgi:hypothetical protein
LVVVADQGERGVDRVAALEQPTELEHGRAQGRKRRRAEPRVVFGLGAAGDDRLLRRVGTGPVSGLGRPPRWV